MISETIGPILIYLRRVYKEKINWNIKKKNKSIPTL